MIFIWRSEIMDDNKLLEQIKNDAIHLKNNFLINFLYNCCYYDKYIPSEAKSFGIELNSQYILVDIFLERTENNEDISRFLRVYGARQLAEASLFNFYRGEVAILSEDELVIMLTTHKSDISDMEELFHSLDKFCNEYSLTYNDHIRICISDIVESFIDISNQFLSMKNNMNIGPIGKNEIFYLSEISNNIDRSIVSIDEFIGPLKVVINNKDTSEIQKLADEIFMSNESLSQSRETCVALIVEIDKILREKDTNINEVIGRNNIIVNEVSKMPTIIATKGWVTDILKLVNNYMTNLDNSRMRFYVDSIRHQIQERYPHLKSVEEICQPLYISVSYANAIFKKETGKSIFDYLVEFRIEKAKELLRDPHMKIYEIVEKVGYLNKSYFTALFKKHTGLSPKDFRNIYVK